MNKPATALSALLVLCVLVLAACGGSSSDGPSTATTTVPGGRLGATGSPPTTVSPPKVGYYAGMECVDHTCSHFTNAFARTQALASCKDGKPAPDALHDYVFRGQPEYFVCFEVRSQRVLINFFASGEKVLASAPLHGQTVPETCNAGWCISGTWSTGGRMTGTARNPNGLSTAFAAEWVGQG